MDKQQAYQSVRSRLREWEQALAAVDEAYPDVPVIRLVSDNSNTRHPPSLYEAFEPAEARRIAERPEIHYTPEPVEGTAAG